MSLYHEALDYHDAGLRLMPLWPTMHGKCLCSNPACTIPGKHPKNTGWQNAEMIDPEKLKIWENDLTCNALGWVLDDNHLILDIDPRNGGTPSLALLQKDLDIDLYASCNAIVKTGGGGLHFIFSKSKDTKLGWKLPKQYIGIDLRMGGGYVVIVGSLHKSGLEYEWYSAAKSDLKELCEAPAKLVAMLTNTYSEHRAFVKSEGLSDIDEIDDMLSYIPPDIHYETWLKIGMAIHNATAGTGFKLWDDWSAKGGSYKEGECWRKWHGFGKNVGDPVQVATLISIAQEHSWREKEDSTFLTKEELDAIKKSWDRKKETSIYLPSIADDSDIDIHNPPGLLGRINDYVYACSVFPNKNLALACSLSVLTNVIGRKYYWPGRFSNIQPNLLVLCIAGSSVGKDSVLGAAHKLLTSVSLGPAIHGRIKSEKDLLDALERNQYAMYYNDEFGYFLQRLNNAMKKGNASYLEGIVGTIMEVFTKGDKSVLLDISRKKAINEEYQEIIGKMEKIVKDGDGNISVSVAKLARARFLIDKFQSGFPNPFLSMFTTATPRTMELAFSGEATENGFLSRAMTFHEYETNPRPKIDYQPPGDVPIGLRMALIGVKFDRDTCPFGRVDSFNQESKALTIEKEAQIFVERSIDYFFELAETQKESGLESLPRRALDGIVKVCIALAAESGTLTLQMARYAVKLVRQEIDRKIRRVNSTELMASGDKQVKMTGNAHRICEICSTETGETLAVIHRQCKSTRVNIEDIQTVLDGLCANGYLEKIDSGRKYAGEIVYRYRSTDKIPP